MSFQIVPEEMEVSKDKELTNTDSLVTGVTEGRIPRTNTDSIVIGVRECRTEDTQRQGENSMASESSQSQLKTSWKTGSSRQCASTPNLLEAKRQSSPPDGQCPQSWYGAEKTRQTSILSIRRILQGKGRKSDVDEAVAMFEEVYFEVIKINRKNKEQKRELRLTSSGILNIRPNGKISSRERWSEVSICYKIDECTVAIKYKNSERVYRSPKKEVADRLFSSLRERINAHQELERKQLRKRMVEGFDEKEKYEAVPNLKQEASINANEVRLRECVEDILLSTDNEIFKLKQRICDFKLTECGKVKELRGYLDKFKYKILEDNREKLLSNMDKKDPDANKTILNVIESVIENACIPTHIDDIYKLLNEESKTSDYLISKVRLLIEKQQEFFGIDKKLESKNDWSNAVVELVNFPKKVLPSAKMQCLLNTARHIHHEAKQNYKKEITGDDLLPIVIFVLVKASDKRGKIIITAADERFVQELINPEALQGERGYYLCVFSAALEFVRNYDRKKIEERFNTIRRLKDFGFF